jgi:hypothetical protein
MLLEQYKYLARLPYEVQEHLRLIVVDDGSPTAPAPFPTSELYVKTKIYRADEDIPWNQDWARNLAVDKASTQWVLLIDMDHVPHHKLLKRIISCDLNNNEIYTFRRVNAPDLSPYKPHPNSWLMTTVMYNKIGGYDERYRGVYGTDGIFHDRALKTASAIKEIKEALIRYPREVIPDASTTTLERKSERNLAMRRLIRDKIKHSGKLEPIRFLTSWHQVYPCSQ